MRPVLLVCGIIVSIALGWFAVSNYRSARPIAEENLRGLALSLTSAIENIALHDPSMKSLDTFQAHDIAFFAIVDQKGSYRFHTNPDLINTPAQDAGSSPALLNGTTSDIRITLRTGESAFEFNAPIYLPKETLALHLTLHTYRADAVIRRAQLTMVVLFGLLAAGWIFAFFLYRFTQREERHQLEMARRENLAHLGEMGAMLAHEIRNPLAGIKGFAQVIEKKPQDERNADFAQRIVSETLRLETLVSELLSYARSDQESTLPVPLTEIISYATEFFRLEADRHRVKIVTECPAEIQLMCNRDRLIQVMFNLIKNAIQATPEEGTVTIAAGTDSRGVLIKVSDTGSGINEEDMRRIFEPFFTTKARGTGLGLALCRKIVEEHGGEITVQSATGAGTIVTISLPRVARPSQNSRS